MSTRRERRRQRLLKAAGEIKDALSDLVRAINEDHDVNTIRRMADMLDAADRFRGLHARIDADDYYVTKSSRADLDILARIDHLPVEQG